MGQVSYKIVGTQVGYFIYWYSDDKFLICSSRSWDTEEDVRYHLIGKTKPVKEPWKVKLLHKVTHYMNRVCWWMNVDRIYFIHYPYDRSKIMLCDYKKGLVMKFNNQAGRLKHGFK